MRTESDAREDLFGKTVTARNRLLSALNVDPDNYGETAINSLVARCPRNAVVLLDELTSSWDYGDVRLRVGALETGYAPLFPDDIGDHDTHWEYLKAHGLIHYWVEATDDTLDKTFHCDLSADRHAAGWPASETTGYPLVTPTPPDEYIALDAAHTPRELSNGECPHNSLVLWWVVWQARQQLLTEHNATEQTSDRLDGICHETSETLLRHLNSAWNTSSDSLMDGDYPHRADHYIQFGGIASGDRNADDFQTRLDVERAGADHFWVEAVDITHDTYYILDCFSNDPDSYGQPIVRTAYPNTYTPVSDGRFPTEAVFHNDTWWRALT